MYYPIEIAKTRSGYRAFCRDIPEMAVAFDSLDELKEKLRAFVPFVLESQYRREKKRIPLPSQALDGEERLYVPLYVQAKIALWNCMVDKGMNLQGLAEMLKVSPAQAQRYVDLSVKKASLESVEEVLHRLGVHLTAIADQ